MTEAEWLAGDDPRPMLRFVEGKASNRKLRLFACAGCRRVWKSLYLKPVRQAVEAAEQFADGGITAVELHYALEQAFKSYTQACQRNFHKLSSDLGYAIKSYKMMLAASMAVPAPLQVILTDAPPPDEGIFRTMFDPVLLRDVVGNPFRPARFDRRSRSSDVTGLAAGIYEGRAFDRLPVLADALMDAGCDDEAMLAHCRSDDPHVRGCWVVDLVLGKE